MEVYAWGTGTYGRLGLGHSQDAQVPQRIGGVLNGCDVSCAACGWYHSVVVTSTGEVAAFGSRVSKCLGTAGSGSEEASDASSPGEASSDDSSSNPAVESGSSSRVTRRGGRRSGDSQDPLPGHSRGPGPRRSTADFVPNTVRSFPSRVTIVQVAVGSDMLGAHTLALTRTGKLFSWGYGPACGVGTTRNVSMPTLVTKFLGTGAGEHGSGRRPPADVDQTYYRFRQRSAADRHLGLQFFRPRIIKAVCGGGFSAVMSSEGEIFTFGLSAGGRLGFRTKFKAQLRPRRIEMMPEGAVDLAAGAGFVLLCSAAGRLLSWGDNSKGQLGIGHLQESHEPAVLGRACPAAFVMESVAAGDSHSLALDSSGRVYSWGGDGGPMTGQGRPLPNTVQVDAAFQFRLQHMHQWWVRPTPLRALLGIRVVQLAAGSLHSLAFSQEGALFAWGAALQAAVAGVASPELAWAPRLLGPGPKLPLVRIGGMAAGGWHSLAQAAPACPTEALLPGPEPGAPRGLEDFCDGYLVSDPDSRPGPGRQARVLLSCAAVRARLALPDGTDSPVWRTFSAQVVRLREDVARGNLFSEEEEDEDDSEAGDLQDIVELHRARRRPLGIPPSSGGSRPAPLSQHPKPGMEVEHTSDADEAAGRALPRSLAGTAPKAAAEGTATATTRAPAPQGRSESVIGGRKRPIPTFSSDSSSRSHSETETPPSGLRSRASTKKRATAPQPQAVQIFSSDSSGSEDSPALRSQRADDGRPGSGSASHGASSSGKTSFLELCKFSEAVLAALVRFLNTDSLGMLEVIDEAHPIWQREQHLSTQGLEVEELSDEEERNSARPTSDRACKGLLLRKELTDLRKVGKVLGLERLACLCDQHLLRLDAPGAPALFVPPSSLHTAMWTLFQQTMQAPQRDGTDTRVLCAPLSPRRARWGPRRIPGKGRGRLQAHAFVLHAGCDALWLEPEGGGPQSDVGQSLCLKRCASGSPWTFELDLQDTPVDVVFAWLRYLYTQDDLLLLWPISGDSPEDVVAAEQFWTELLRLARRLGDRKLLLYAQDSLVGALSSENWPHMAIFAEQVPCPILSEAALMWGVRTLLPALLVSFKVATGLEQGETSNGPEEAINGSEEQSATRGAAGGRQGQGTAACGKVELELERHLTEIIAKAQGPDSAALLALKTGKSEQYAELKQRLAETVTSALRIGDQLHRCVQFYNSHELRGFRRDEKQGRALYLELLALGLCICFFVIPSDLRQTVLATAAMGLEPVRASMAYLDLSWLAPFYSGIFRVMVINAFLLIVLAAAVIQNLSK